ncbi:MAG: 50S ribosomal protein L4 [Acidobacteriota bacterium]|nr:50S ribosomal protein L4 [Acidobacteriota bacterium]
MKIEVRSLTTKKVKKIEVPEAVFAYPYKEHLIHTAVRANRAAQRAGTHKSKARGEITGSTRKPWRQKGTGRARAGSAKSPLWRGGGTTHGPRPRSHSLGLSAREKRNALKSALSKKLEQQGLVVLDTLELGSHKTAELANHLEALGIAGRVLIVDDYENLNLGLAVRNNPRLKAVDALGLTVYDVVDRSVILSEQALGRLLEVLSK